MSALAQAYAGRCVWRIGEYVVRFVPAMPWGLCGHCSLLLVTCFSAGGQGSRCGLLAGAAVPRIPFPEGCPLED